jgi:hypothetical protein
MTHSLPVIVCLRSAVSIAEEDSAGPLHSNKSKARVESESNKTPRYATCSIHAENPARVPSLTAH